jgi:DNA-directed RNA polymerase subunit H (RpoH/RPB5)
VGVRLVWEREEEDQLVEKAGIRKTRMRRMTGSDVVVEKVSR